MIRLISPIIAGAAVLLLAACSAGPSLNAPVPDPADTPSGSPTLAPAASPSPTSTSVAEKQGWFVEGQNSYLSGSAHYCSWDDRLTTVNTEYPGFGFSVLGSPPDDWNGTDIWDDSSASVGLNIATRKYTAQRYDGEAGYGTSWFTNGTFTFDRNAEGVITGGRGTGKTKIGLPGGDVQRTDDVMTFTVKGIDEAEWCNF